jgi:hypothetical protein
MVFIALVSLAFSGWMAWTLYSSLREETPSGWRDYLSTVWIAAGSLAGIVTAVFAVLQ